MKIKTKLVTVLLIGAFGYMGSAWAVDSEALGDELKKPKLTKNVPQKPRPSPKEITLAKN